MEKNNQTLLAKAKKIKSRRQFKNSSKELEELALAWAHNEITLSQVCAALGTSLGSQTYCRLAIGLREVVKRNNIRFVKKQSSK